MSNTFLLRFKLALAVLSLVFFVIGSKLLFGNWASIHWGLLMFAGLILYGGVYTTLKRIFSSDIQIIFAEFDVVSCITFTVCFLLATAMLLIFYKHVSLIFFGFSVILLVGSGSLRFITLDFKRKTVAELLGPQPFNLAGATITVDAEAGVIQIGKSETQEEFKVNRTRFKDKVWIELVSSIVRLDTRVQ